MSQQQQQQQQQGTGSSSMRPDPEAETSLPKQGKPRDSDVTYKDQMREPRLPSSSRGMAATGVAAIGGERARKGKRAFEDVPIVSAVAVSDSQVVAEEQEDRLQVAEKRAAAFKAAQRVAEAERRAAEAARQDQEVRLAQLEQQLAAVLPTPPQPQEQPPAQQPPK
jgi:hypothetical protein